MKIHKPLTSASGDVRELTLEDLKHFKPASEVLSELAKAEVASGMLAKHKPVSELDVENLEWTTAEARKTLSFSELPNTLLTKLSRRARDTT